MIVQVEFSHGICKLDLQVLLLKNPYYPYYPKVEE